MKLKKIIEIKYQDNIINVDLDNATIIDGYIPILYTNKIGEDRYIVITSIIKEDGTVLVPFRKSIATKDEVDNYLFDNDISVYKNNKAIYKVSDDLFYVIDLEKTEFTKKNDKIIPVNPLLKMVCYYGIDDKKIIVYKKDCAYLYDIANNNKISPNYDFIKPYEGYDGGHLTYYVLNHNKYSKPLIISMSMTEDGGIYNQAILNHELTVILPINILGDKEKIINYCDSCYDDYIESEELSGERVILQ